MNNPTPFTLPSASETSVDEELAARGELFNSLGQRMIIQPGEVGKPKVKLSGYTRATTFIDAIDDKTALSKWRIRLILEGSLEAGLENRTSSAIARRLELSGAEFDKKVIEEAEKACRAELDEISEHAFSLAGGHDKADYGTALHNLAEHLHRDTLTEEILVDTDDRWPGILEDFTAYANAYDEFVMLTGAKIIRIEALMVDDKMKIAGRTDLVLLAKLPGDTRARRIIFDIKTGKIDNGRKLSQQLAIYSGSKFYDPETGIRTHSRIRQDVGIIAHVPKGEGRAEFHVVQLEPGRKANRLCAQVRQARRKVPGIMSKIASAEVGA